MWRENSGGYQCGCCADYQYILTGDTLIDGTVYHKIQYSGVSYLEDPGGMCTTTIQGYFNYYRGAFREDVVNKKVYLRQPGSSSDTLIYDFDLSLGDTLPALLTNQINNNWVSKIDSVLVSGIYHKQFWISADTAMNEKNYASIIEGVGSSLGLLAGLIPPFESGSNLYCLSINDSLVYPFGTFVTVCEPVAVGITEKSNSENVFLYPNPSNGKFELKFNNQKFNFIEITDVFSNIVLKKQLQKETTDIDLSEHPNGIYIVKMCDQKGNYLVKKIVKQ